MDNSIKKSGSATGEGIVLGSAYRGANGYSTVSPSCTVSFSATTIKYIFASGGGGGGGDGSSTSAINVYCKNSDALTVSCTKTTKDGFTCYIPNVNKNIVSVTASTSYNHADADYHNAQIACTVIGEK